MAAETRAVRNISAGAVAAIAAWSSYSHMVHVALTFGEHPEVAYALPCSVDGMLIVASVVMVDDKRRNVRVRPVARLAFAAGVLASVAANIAAAHPSIGARIVAAWPAVALLLVVEMLARPPVPAAAEAPAEAAAQRPSPAEAVAAVLASTQVPPAVPTAGDQRRPPLAAHLPHGSCIEPISTEAPTSSAAEAEDGGAYPLPAATTRSPQPVPHMPPLAAVPPLVVPPKSGDVPPEVTQRRRERGGAWAAEPTRAPVDRGGHIDPPPQTAGRQRRPAAATRRLALQIIDAEPHLSRNEVAARLGLSTRRLREVLATPA